MYDYDVEGQYITTDKNARLKPFEAQFTLREKNKDIARAIIQNGIVKDYLKENNEDYRSLRTCQVFEAGKTKNTEATIDEEMETLLAEASQNGVIPITLDEYGKRGKKEALKTAVDKNKKAKKKAAEKKKKAEKGK